MGILIIRLSINLMKQNVIHPKEGLQLRKIKDRYMIVVASDGNVNMSDVYSLNRTAADLWQQICNGEYSAEELAEWLSDTYPVEPSKALRDVERQLSEWKSYGLLD